MPLTIKRTNSTAAAAYSVLFNGSSQYLSIANNAAFNFGTGSFTVEFWFYATANVSSQQCLITNYSDSSAGWAIQIESGVIGANLSGDGFDISGGSPATNTWYHAALSGAQGSIKLFLNGVQVGSTYTGVVSMNTSAATTIGAIIGIAKIAGYISNVRVVKGTALYTSSFTPPTAPLTAIANTSLLTCNAATIVDSSTNNFAITNNGAATVSSVTPTFLALSNNFQFAKRTSDAVGNSVLFNGSTQYLSVPGNAAFAFGTGSFTTEWWQYMTSQTSYPRVFSIGNYPSATIGVSIEGGTFYVWENSGVRFSYSLTAEGYLNRWLHFAISRNNGTTSIFKNGIQIGASYPDTNNINNTSTALSIGQESTPTANSYFPGYISNFRILNGTALYTASFTAPNAPLTAIANTSLLTCNAATIVDSSTNNFTITNTGTATVSSITPFVTPSGGMSLKKVYADPITVYLTQKAIFGYGYTNSGILSITNLVSNTGVVANDVTGVGTARMYLAAAGYGGDKVIFGYGTSNEISSYSMTNLVSNTGAVATDTTGVGTARYRLAAAGYGSDKALFGYGTTGTVTAVTNLVSNTGVVATDTTGVGTARHSLAAAGYGTDKAIFGYGTSNFSNLVSNTGVVATDTTGVGTSRYVLAAAGYGTDKAIFGYGYTTTYVSMTNKVSNTGVVATDTTGVGTIRHTLSAAGYGTDKAIFGYGDASGGTFTAITNLVSNTGVVATDTAGVGTGRRSAAAAGYSLT